MEGLVPQLIAAGVGGGIVALLGLIGLLFRIFVRLGRLEKTAEVLEAGLKTTQDNVQKLQQNLHQTEVSLREDLRQTETRLREDLRQTETRLREDLRQTEIRLRQEFREEMRQTEERLRELIRAESEATREATRREIRRLTDAFVVHSHEPDGTILYRVLPSFLEPRADGAGE